MEEAVESLLRSAGVPAATLELSEPEILRYADRATASMAELYDYVNTSTLEAIAESGAIGIIHITGEARVLVDPQARRVIWALWKMRVPTTLVMRQREPRIEDADTMLGAVQDDWNGITLADLSDILSLARVGALKIYVVEQDPEIHFSLFGEDRILIQEPQSDETELKRVWYLRSEEIAAALRIRAEDYVYGAMAVPPMTFGTLLAWLGSKEITTLLTEHDGRSNGGVVIPRVERKKLLKTGFLRNDGGIDLVRKLPRGGRNTHSQETAAAVPVSTRVSEASSDEPECRVLVLQPSTYPQVMREALSGVLRAKGLLAVWSDSQLITPDELRDALSHRRIIALVASVGSAAETLHLLNFHWSSRQATWPQLDQKNLGSSPDIQVLVPQEFKSAYFTRVVKVTYGAPIRFFEAESVESIRSAVGEVASAWASIEAATRLAEAAPSGPGMDEQSRRARSTVRTWIQGEYI